MKFKEGDKVKIIGNKLKGRMRIGDIAEILSIKNKDARLKNNENKVGTCCWYLLEDIELIEKIDKQVPKVAETKNNGWGFE